MLWSVITVIAMTPPCLEVTTFDHYRRRLPDVRTHWSRLDPSVAITSYQNLPVVVAPLSVVQIARDGDRYLVERVANDLVRRNVTTFAEILEWIDTARDGPRTHLRVLCVNALNVGGHFDSPTCRQLCLRLTMAGATGFRIDFQVADAQGVLLIDIAWPASKVGIEYNGAQYHDNALARANDGRRRNRLAAAGWTMLQADHTMSLDDVVHWGAGRARDRAEDRLMPSGVSCSATTAEWPAWPTAELATGLRACWQQPRGPAPAGHRHYLHEVWRAFMIKARADDRLVGMARGRVVGTVERRPPPRTRRRKGN